MKAGWNAVWLRVAPQYTTVEEAGEAMRVTDVFDDDAITIVAKPLTPAGTAEFVTDASQTKFDQSENWQVWRRESELGRDTLSRIYGNTGYLVYVAGGADVNLPVSGAVEFKAPAWAPDSYNLVGFNLVGSTTFASYFAAANGQHPTNRIFALEPSGNWVSVAGGTQIIDGAAYWIYADGTSTYGGAVSIGMSGRQLDFGTGPGNIEVADPVNNGATLLVTRREITFTNVSTSAASVKITLVDPESAPTDLAVYPITPASDNLGWEPDATGQLSAYTVSVPASSSQTISLGAVRDWNSGARTRENVYRVEVNNQYYLWLPATASNSDIVADATGTGPAQPSYAGLWLGTVSLKQVSSITEAGSPVEATQGGAKMRILLHVNASGQVSLVNAVMLMKTKTASATVAAEQVLVVDQNKIPNFEGIEERDGYHIGKRLETVSYDMPRSYDPGTQTTLVSTVATANNEDLEDVTAADIQTYVNGSASRPPSLVESYALSWPLEGGLGAGQSVKTSAGSPLTLDPFHRSNPFRHAYHPRHATGFAITRAMLITFDAKYTSGALEGDYEETVTGLVNGSLTSRGRIYLQRVSTVTTLQ